MNEAERRQIKRDCLRRAKARQRKRKWRKLNPHKNADRNAEHQKNHRRKLIDVRLEEHLERMYDKGNINGRFDEHPEQWRRCKERIINHRKIERMKLRSHGPLDEIDLAADEPISRGQIGEFTVEEFIESMNNFADTGYL